MNSMCKAYYDEKCGSFTRRMNDMRRVMGNEPSIIFCDYEKEKDSMQFCPYYVSGETFICPVCEELEWGTIEYPIEDKRDGVCPHCYDSDCGLSVLESKGLL